MAAARKPDLIENSRVVSHQDLAPLHPPRQGSQKPDGPLPKTAPRACQRLTPQTKVTLLCRPSRQPWRATVVSALAQGVVVEALPEEGRLAPKANRSVQLIATEDILPAATTGTVVGRSPRQAAIELITPWRSRNVRLVQQGFDRLPLRARILAPHEVNHVRLALQSSSVTVDVDEREGRNRGLPRLDLASSGGQFANTVARLQEQLLWQGLSKGAMDETDVLFTAAGLCFASCPSQSPDQDRPPVGALLELEVLLPLYGWSRLRALARVERYGEEISDHHLVARFVELSSSGRHALSGYLDELRLATPAAREGTEHPGPNREKSPPRSPRPYPAATTDHRPVESALPRHWPATTPSRGNATDLDGQWRNPGSSAPPWTKDDGGEVRQLESVLADVFDSMRGLYEQPTFTHAIDFALRVAQKAVPTRLALGFRATDPSRPPEVACVARQGRTERVQLGQVFDSRGSLLEWAWHHNRPVAVDGDGAGQTLSADIDCPLGAETNSVLCVPADHDGRTFGLLMLVNREPAGRWYHGDRNILCYIAGRLGQFAAESLPDPTDQDDESISKH